MLFIFWVFVLTFGSVKCSYVSENYIIEEPDNDVPKTFNTSFKVYWNIPTKQCRSKKIPFDDLLKKYLITYNKDDRFEGEHITILYDGGYMPRILKSDGAKYTLQNGGLPQEGNLELHLMAFRESVNRLIPDPDFNGVGVIDMENWRPIFRQHWSGLAPVVDLSLSIEKRQYWWWPNTWQKMEATKRFEDAARLFMEKTLTTAKQMRPKAVWGYYGYPYCYNMYGNNMAEHCSKNVKDENDRTYWLWAESTALYPSIYSSSSLSTFELKKLVSGRLTEANRVKLNEVPVMPYFALTYNGKGSSFLFEEEVDAVFETLQKKQASGLIVWGSSNDVSTVDKCNQLYKYIDSSFGPIAKKYIQKITKIQEQINLGNEKYDSENYLNDIYAPIETTGLKDIFNYSIDYEYTTKKYELGDNETVNENSSKNTSFTDDFSILISYLENEYSDYLERFSKEKMSQNTPANITWNEFINSSETVSNPVLSVDVSVTEPNADYAQIKNQEQLLKKYFYNSDVSDLDFKSNVSEIWSVKSYDSSVEQEKRPEIYNSSTNNTKSFLNVGKTENTSSKINHIDDFNNGTLKNTIYPLFETTYNAENNITKYDMVKIPVNINLDNLSHNFNITEVASEFKPATEKEQQLSNHDNGTDDREKDNITSSNASEIWSIKFYSEDISPNIKKEDQLNIYETYPIIENTANLSDVFNYLVITERDLSQINTSVISNDTGPELILLPPNNYSKDLPQNITEEEQANKSQKYHETLTSGQNNMSDNLNISVNNDSDTGTTENIQSKSNLDYLLFSANDFIFDGETVPCESNNTITFPENTNQVLNTSQHINETVVEENVNEGNSPFTPPQNVKYNVQLIKSTTDFSIEATVSINNNDSDFENTLKKETKPSNVSINYNDTRIIKNVKSNSSLDANFSSQRENTSNTETVPRERNNLINTSVYGNVTVVKENVNSEERLFTLTPRSDKQDDQLIKNTNNSNTEAKLSTENNDSDYLVTLSEEPSDNILTKASESAVFGNRQALLPSEFFVNNFDYLITLVDETKDMNRTLNKNNTHTLENFKQNTSQFTIIPPKIDSNYSNSNQEDKIIKNIVTPNGEATDYEEYDDEGY